MPRLLLSDGHCSKLEKILLQHAIYNKRHLRMTVEGMLYRMRVGCLWRDLPKASGCWSAIYKRFNAWSASGKWLSIFKTLVVEPDWEWVFIDGSYAKAHQHSAGAASDDRKALGKAVLAIPRRSIWPWMPKGYRWSLPSLAARSMTAQRRPPLSLNYRGRVQLLQTKATTASACGSRSNPREAKWSFRESRTRLKETLIWTGACIAIGIWWKTPLLA